MEKHKRVDNGRRHIGRILKKESLFLIAASLNEIGGVEVTASSMGVGAPIIYTRCSGPPTTISDGDLVVFSQDSFSVISREGVEHAGIMVDGTLAYEIDGPEVRAIQVTLENVAEIINEVANAPFRYSLSVDIGAGAFGGILVDGPDGSNFALPNYWLVFEDGNHISVVREREFKKLYKKA